MALNRLHLWVKEDEDMKVEGSECMMVAALVAFAVLEEKHCTLQQESWAEKCTN